MGGGGAEQRRGFDGEAKAERPEQRLDVVVGMGGARSQPGACGASRPTSGQRATARRAAGGAELDERRGGPVDAEEAVGAGERDERGRDGGGAEGEGDQVGALGAAVDAGGLVAPARAPPQLPFWPDGLDPVPDLDAFDPA